MNCFDFLKTYFKINALQLENTKSVGLLLKIVNRRHEI